MGQLTLSKRPARMGIATMYDDPPFQVRGFLAEIIHDIAYDIMICNMYLQYKKKLFLLQVKSKSHVGGTEHVFILGSTVRTVANNIRKQGMSTSIMMEQILLVRVLESYKGKLLAGQCQHQRPFKEKIDWSNVSYPNQGPFNHTTSKQIQSVETVHLQYSFPTF